MRVIFFYNGDGTVDALTYNDNTMSVLRKLDEKEKSLLEGIAIEVVHREGALGHIHAMPKVKQ